MARAGPAAREDCAELAATARGGGHGGRPARARMRRGDVRAAILLLVAEEPATVIR